MAKHIGSVAAYPNVYMTYTGFVYDRVTKQSYREVFDTYDEARNWAKAKAWEVLGPITYAPLRRKGEYMANCWKEV